MVSPRENSSARGNLVVDRQPEGQGRDHVRYRLVGVQQGLWWSRLVPPHGVRLSASLFLAVPMTFGAPHTDARLISRWRPP